MDRASLVSIVVAAFNAADTLEATLESVAAQTWRDFEVIVVDDGSTDSTSALLESCACKWTWLRHARQQNSGVATARNHGIRLARGEFIAFLDADDLWAPDKLSSQMPLFCRHPEIALVYGNSIDFSSGSVAGRSLFEQKAPHRGRVLQQLLMGCFILTSSVVVRKKVLVHVGGFVDGLRLFEDVDLFLRIAENHDVDYVHQILVHRRVRPDSLSHRDPLANQMRDLEIFDHWIARRPDLFLRHAREVRRHRAMVYERMGRTHLSNRSWSRSRLAYRRAIALGQRNPAVLIRFAAAHLAPLARLYWLIKTFIKRNLP